MVALNVEHSWTPFHDPSVSPTSSPYTIHPFLTILLFLFIEELPIVVQDDFNVIVGKDGMRNLMERLDSKYGNADVRKSTEVFQDETFTAYVEDVLLRSLVRTTLSLFILVAKFSKTIVDV